MDNNHDAASQAAALNHDLFDHTWSYTYTDDSEPRSKVVQTFLDSVPTLSPIDLPENNRDCPICIESYGDSPHSERPVRLPCGHIMGKDCLSEWLNSSNLNANNNSCPTCRAVLFEQFSLYHEDEEDEEDDEDNTYEPVNPWVPHHGPSTGSDLGDLRLGVHQYLRTQLSERTHQQYIRLRGALGLVMRLPNVRASREATRLLDRLDEGYWHTLRNQTYRARERRVEQSEATHRERADQADERGQTRPRSMVFTDLLRTITDLLRTFREHQPLHEQHDRIHDLTTRVIAQLEELRTLLYPDGGNGTLLARHGRIHDLIAHTIAHVEELVILSYDRFTDTTFLMRACSLETRINTLVDFVANNMHIERTYNGIHLELDAAEWDIERLERRMDALEAHRSSGGANVAAAATSTRTNQSPSEGADRPTAVQGRTQERTRPAPQARTDHSRSYDDMDEELQRAHPGLRAMLAALRYYEYDIGSRPELRVNRAAAMRPTLPRLETRANNSPLARAMNGAVATSSPGSPTEIQNIARARIEQARIYGPPTPSQSTTPSQSQTQSHTERLRAVLARHSTPPSQTPNHQTTTPRPTLPRQESTPSRASATVPSVNEAVRTVSSINGAIAAASRLHPVGRVRARPRSEQLAVDGRWEDVPALRAVADRGHMRVGSFGGGSARREIRRTG